MSEKTGKYSGIIKAKHSGKPANQQTSKPDKEVNLCVRVPQSQRRWWAAQAKMEGKSMTDVIKAAMIAEFGLPPAE